MHQHDQPIVMPVHRNRSWRSWKVVFICFIFDPRTKWSSTKHSFACFTHSERSSAKHWDSLDPHIVKEISATGHYGRRRGHPIMKMMIISSIFNSNGEYIDTIHQIYWLNSIDVSLFVDCWVCHQTQIQTTIWWTRRGLSNIDSFIFYKRHSCLYTFLLVEKKLLLHDPKTKLTTLIRPI